MVEVYFYAAAFFFGVTFLLGVGVQSGVLDTSGFGWIHHMLFFATAASAVVAAAAGIYSGEGFGFLLLPVLGLYVILPRVRAGTAGHAAIACAAMVFYIAGFLMTLG